MTVINIYIIYFAGAEEGSTLKSNNQNNAVWEKRIHDTKGNYAHNIQDVKMRAEFLEEQAKQKEMYLKYAGGFEKNPDECQKLSTMKIEAIKAKLAILEGITAK